MAPIAEPGKKVGVRDLINGGLLQCVEAATLGMPFEVDYMRKLTCSPSRTRA